MAVKREHDPYDGEDGQMRAEDIKQEREAVKDEPHDVSANEEAGEEDLQDDGAY